MTKVKICGIQTVEHGLCALEVGADYIGFVFAKSKRQVSQQQAREIIGLLREKRTTGKMVGVFVNTPLKEMEEIARICDLDILQLHGEESEQTYEGSSFPIIKSVSVKAGEKTTDELSRHMLSHKKIDYLLFDTWHKEMAGGSGESFEWTALDKKKMKAPFFLAGGLSVENVKEAIRTAKPYAVDVSSGVETEGVKDMEKIKGFIRKVKECDYGI